MRPQLVPIILIIVGTALLLTNLNLLPMAQVKLLLRDWWPVILIAMGVLQLMKK